MDARQSLLTAAPPPPVSALAALEAMMAAGACCRCAAEASRTSSCGRQWPRWFCRGEGWGEPRWCCGGGGGRSMFFGGRLNGFEG
eukprot:357082-Chlamydomonas_euryale.AAC.2